MNTVDRLTILPGDALTVLKTLPDESVQCCVTSPPYYSLRDYGVEGQIGLEETVEEYIEKLVIVFREVKRVLRADGTLWCNMGDCYSAQAGQRKSTDARGPKQCTNRGSSDLGSRAIEGLKPKDLVGVPWMLAFALRSDGWWLRQDIIWHKPNPMPESVTDRCTKAHEYIFLLTKSAGYFWDAEAIKEPSVADHGAGNGFAGRQGGASHLPMSGGTGSKEPWTRGKHSTTEPQSAGHRIVDNVARARANGGNHDSPFGPTRNKRSVWTVATDPYSEAHFATFPPDLIKPCILAGTSARGCCPKCGAPWERQIEKSVSGTDMRRNDNGLPGRSGLGFPVTRAGECATTTTGWEPTCSCGLTDIVPCTVLDCFGGSGTSGMVALELGRNAILIELNPAYIKLAEQRCRVTPGLALA